jgi:demethylmenaquinone methyltransferase/2-methoxy-6-polyprenyl-1,4-benzoquinol methylase
MLLHEGHATAQRFFTPANAASYDRVARHATFGRDRVWKGEIVKRVSGCQAILELACGTGVLSSMLLQPERRVTGLDLTFDYLAETKSKLGLDLAQGTAELLPYRAGQFDSVVSSYLAKYVDMQLVARECHRILQPGGIAVFHDFTYPANPLMAALWKFYFKILQLAGTFAPAWSSVFDNLAEFIQDSKWEAKTVQALEQAGFTNIETKYHTAGTAAVVAAEKP